MSKIVIIGPAYPLRGGLSTFNERLAREFTLGGHSVVIYTFSLQYPSFLFPGKTQYSDSPPPQDIKIVPIINSINPVNWWLGSKKIKAENADLIIFRYWLPFMGPCLGSIARMVKTKKSKLIGLVDNALPHEKRLGDRYFTKYFTAVMDGFVTMSDYVRNDLLSFTNKPIHLVNHPLTDNYGPKFDVNVSRQKLKLPKNAFIFLFFGFIRKYKGLDLLIDAFEKLKDENTYLLIAGEYYAGEDDIKHQIATSSAKDRILEHTHFIPNEDVGLYFSAANCVVQPYRNATQSGVTPLAYHYEIPMIVTNVGALPDLVPSSLGRVCVPDALSISLALNDLLEFDLDTFGKAITEEKKKLSWEKFMRELLNF